jgi:glyoxylase-like metal-dependent hydrolase (beta-lactamase superfamily II)
MRIGAVDVLAISDGGCKRAPSTWYADASPEDLRRHREHFDEDGLLDVAFGAFVVLGLGRVVLVDAGIGPDRKPAHGTAGKLLESLESRLGLRPADVTDVVFTHLHSDHVGWATCGRNPTFRNARYWCHAADWEFFVGDDPEATERAWSYSTPATALHLAGLKHRMQTWSSDGPVMPSIEAHWAPGHTPGSTVIVVTSDGERALLLGDVAHSPIELLEPSWTGVADVEPATARQTRARIVEEWGDTAIPMAGAHFPGMRFGHLVRQGGTRVWRYL